MIIVPLTTPLHTQEVINVKTEMPALLLTQGYVFESINGKGFSNCTGNHIANITSSNPASISDFKKMSFGLSCQFESSVKPAWIENMNHERDKADFTQSFGLILPFKRLAIGFGFSQRYNSILDFGKMERTTIENPEGTGEYISASESDRATAYSCLLSYSFENATNNHDRLSLGIQCNYNQLNVKDRMFHSSLKVKTDNFGWTGGMHYQASDRLQFGIFYERNPVFRDRIKYQGKELLTQIDHDPASTGNNQNMNTDLVTEINLEGKLPDKLHAGVLYKLNSFLKISFEMTRIYWNQLSDNSKNQINLSAGLTNDIAKHMSFSVGLLSTDRQYNKINYTSYKIDNKLYGLFLLIGFNLQIRSVNLDFAYVSNTDNSGEWREQNFGKLSVGFYL